MTSDLYPWRAQAPLRHLESQGRFRIAYRVWGKQGPLVVLVNAIMETMSAWTPVVDHLVPLGFRVVVFDFPISQRSDIINGADEVSLDEKVGILRDVVMAVREGRSEERVGLLSSSWGSMVAARFAGFFPHWIERMLLGSFGLTINTALADVLERVARAVERGDTQTVASVIASSFGQRVPRSLIETMRTSLQARSDREWRVFFAHVREFREIGRADALVDFSKIPVLTMWLNGLNDEIVDLGGVLRTAATMPAAEVVLVPEVGHFMHFENPLIIKLFGAFFLAQPLPGEVSGLRFLHATVLGRA